ncbi:MAG: formate dehydrogenase accessory sulfurtransferase FdhD, partial [Promethearchaeota archaeon]
AAVTSGIELAEAAGVTLIGFVRGLRMNIYTHPERILIKTN